MHSIVANHEIGRARGIRIGQSRGCAEILHSTATVQLKANTSLTFTIPLPWADHEGQVKPGAARASVEIEPFGPRVLPHRSVRDCVEAIDLPEDNLRRGVRPRNILLGIPPFGSECHL